MRFYHIDRDKSLTKNTIFPYPTPQNCAISEKFPTISQHGVHYLLHHENDTQSVLCEWILEYVRATIFPSMPSRFQSLFVSRTKQGAFDWATYWKIKDYNLVEIEANKFYELDSSWFTNRQALPISFLKSLSSVHLEATARIFEEAVKYWGGERSNNPRPEILIPLPFRVTNIYHQID